MYQRIDSMLLTCCLLGCTNLPPSQATPTHDALADGAAEVHTYQARWNEANITHYRFQLMDGCFCPMHAIMPITVEVDNDVVTSMTDAQGVPVAPDEAGSGFFRKYTTIDGIYDALTSAQFRNADTLTVTYDATYPIPATVSADFIAMAVDDELYVRVNDFLPLE